MDRNSVKTPPGRSAPTRRDILEYGAAAAVAAPLAASTARAASPSSTAQAKDADMNTSQGDLSAAIMLFDDITQLDATAPLEVFASAPGFSVFTVSPGASMVTASAGLKMQADYAYDNAPPADILCVPGGQGVNPLMTDAPTLDYIRRTARNTV